MKLEIEKNAEFDLYIRESDGKIIQVVKCEWCKQYDKGAFLMVDSEGVYRWAKKVTD